MSVDKKVLRELDRYRSDEEITQARTSLGPWKVMAAGGIVLAALFIIALFLRAAP